MQFVLLMALALLAPVQAGTQFAGTWTAEHSGATFVWLELRAAQGSTTRELKPVRLHRAAK